MKINDTGTIIAVGAEVRHRRSRDSATGGSSQGSILVISRRHSATLPVYAGLEAMSVIACHMRHLSLIESVPALSAYVTQIATAVLEEPM